MQIASDNRAKYLCSRPFESGNPKLSIPRLSIPILLYVLAHPLSVEDLY
jgi:hypothetical protein